MALINTIASVTTIIRGLINDQIQLDGKNAFSFKTDNKFFLSESFVQSSSIIVYQNGVDITSSNWTYNSDTNEVDITFTVSGSSLTVDDIIVITYNYYKKYSDTEIQGFITSALGYFVQYRWCKIFEVNTDDEIVSIDNLDPEIKELYFIAIISSILIDPQNIKIDTPEFKLSPKRDLSDQAQIAKSFAQFKRFVGSVTFNKRIDNNNIL